MDKDKKPAATERPHTPATPCILYGIGPDGRLAYASTVSDVGRLYSSPDCLARYLSELGPAPAVLARCAA